MLAALPATTGLPANVLPRKAAWSRLPLKTHASPHWKRHPNKLSKKTGRSQHYYWYSTPCHLSGLYSSSNEEGPGSQEAHSPHSGWPSLHLQIWSRPGKVCTMFHELSYIEGVATCGHQLVIPESLQEHVISICHKGHLGIVKTKQLLRSRVWFPETDKSMERKFGRCIPCQASSNSFQCEPLKMSPMPKGQWLQVSADFPQVKQFWSF